MKLRFALMTLLLSSNFLGMDRPQDSSCQDIGLHKSLLIKFMDSDDFDIEHVNGLFAARPIENGMAIQELLTKALAKLVMFWNSDEPEFEKFEKNGLRLAQNLLKAGADPRAQATFEERIYWDKKSTNTSGQGDSPNKYRGSEASYKSTILEEAQGSLLACLKEYIARDVK